MDPSIDHRRLLEEVLAAPDATADPVATILGAVRARRRRRQLAPLACATAFVVLACVWTVAPWSSREAGRASQADVALVVPLAVAKPAVERVRSRPLSVAERIATDFAAGPVRFRTRPDDTLRASDDELLAMVGGRGVGLFRVNGRTELLFAADAARPVNE